MSKKVQRSAERHSVNSELTFQGQPKLFPELPSKVMFGDTSSDKRLSRAKEWISHCCSSHISCQQLPTTLLPKRVLDVKESMVRLVERNQSGRYICLSHCWGQSRPLCLTKRSTIQDNLQRIPWESLPKTFQHAIEVTRKLGIRFLWIDSICIIQDDKRDWEEESSKMASIYQNSYLTICATSAVSDDAGLWPCVPAETVKFAAVQKGSTTFEVYFRDTRVVEALHLRDRHVIPIWEQVKILCPFMNDPSLDFPRTTTITASTSL